MQSIEEHINSLVAKGDPVQPFLLGLGDIKTFKITQFFIYLDGKLIIFDNFQRAFDICFKSFHLFNVEYPLASNPFWTFVEQYLYNISKSTKNINTKVCLLLNELSKI